MTLTDLYKKIASIINDLRNADLTNEQKFEQAVQEVVTWLETFDNAVVMKLIPAPWNIAANAMVDNEVVDAWEEALARVAVEAVYQGLEAVRNLIDFAGDKAEEALARVRDLVGLK